MTGVSPVSHLHLLHPRGDGHGHVYLLAVRVLPGDVLEQPPEHPALVVLGAGPGPELSTNLRSFYSAWERPLLGPSLNLLRHYNILHRNFNMANRCEIGTLIAKIITNWWL